VDTIAVTGRFDLTDAQWAVLEPLLPTAKRPGRPSLWTKRQLIDGMRWRVRVGAPWRDVPVEYGSWAMIRTCGCWALGEVTWRGAPSRG
jgi:transposase